MDKVAFRKFPIAENSANEGDIIALFPDIEADSQGHIMSYMRIGQHGAADKDLLTKLAKAEPSEYANLKQELENIGYKLELIS